MINSRPSVKFNKLSSDDAPAASCIKPSAPILIVPGLNNSGPGHWQGRWLSTLPGATLVDQANWNHPVLCDWIARLVEAIRQTPGAILVGHSLGCALIAHVAALPEAQSIAGALLAAPADVDAEGPEGDQLRGFSPLPRARLPFPTIVAASRNDPFVAFERAQAFAWSWGARFVDVGAAGHINVASGHGPWPQGDALLQALSDEVSEGRRGQGPQTATPWAPERRSRTMHSFLRDWRNYAFAASCFTAAIVLALLALRPDP